jgi:3-hydroxyisobutyrate dehydrogenase-like beta-hydroxyacid dehydrogenase
MADVHNRAARVALLGLGSMGRGIGARLLANGHSLTVHNRSSSKAQALVGHGARLASSPADAVRNAEVVFTALRGQDVELEVATGAQGFAAAMSPGALHVSLSTLSPSVAKQLADRHARNGTRYLSAPMQGRAQAAASGQLLLWVSGSKQYFNTAAPILAAFAARTCYLGESVELAPATKLAVNMLMFSNIELFAETSVYLSRCGLDAAQVLGVLTETAFAAPLFKGIAGTLQGNHASDGTNVLTSLVDLNLLLGHARAVDARVPCAAAVAASFEDAVRSGFGEMSQSAVVLALSRRAKT